MDINVEKTTGNCWRAICNATGLQMEDLVIRANRARKADNEGILSAGDVIVLWCATCNLSPHVVICGGFDVKGQATNYAHNSAKNKQSLWVDVASYGNYSGEHSEHLTMGKVIRLSTLSNDKKVLVSSNFNSDCPVEMVVTINGETLDSRNILSGTISNHFATMNVYGSGQEREIGISIVGESITDHAVQLEFVGTDIGQMNLAVTHVFNDGSVDTYTFPNVSLTGTTTGYIDSMEPNLLVRMIKQDSRENSDEIWVAYPHEIIKTQTPNRISNEEPSMPELNREDLSCISIPTVANGEIIPTPATHPKANA